MITAHRVTQFNESVIRDMTRLAMQHGAINLSQGFPDFPTEPSILQAAVEAIEGGINQYTVTWGYPPLREKLAELYTERLGWSVHPDRNVTVTCGVTEGIVTSIMSIMNPGDEIIIPEPAHDNFRPSAYMAGAQPVPVPLQAPAFRLTAELLETAVSDKTRAILLNSPHNPTGRVFEQDEVQAVIDLVLEHDLILITDEIYDRILYDGRVHVSPGSNDAVKDRTITIGGFGKTYAVTGWRLGYVIAPDSLATGLRAVHDFTTICAPTPLQAAGVAALSLPDSFYAESMVAYHKRREMMLGILEEAGMHAAPPQGAYYVMADYSDVPLPQASLPPMEFARWMTMEVGVAVVPGHSFYTDTTLGESLVRFAFPKKYETLESARARIQERFNSR